MGTIGAKVDSCLPTPFVKLISILEATGLDLNWLKCCLGRYGFIHHLTHLGHTLHNLLHVAHLHPYRDRS